MAKAPDTPKEDKDWQLTLDQMQQDKRRQGATPLGPVQLPSGQMYLPADTPNPTIAPVQKVRMKRGGKVKHKPKGVGCALRGHTRAK